jgi:glycosyltransferase involved in cell wall biosynthesis
LGFHYHVPAYVVEGALRMPGYLGRFIDGLAQHCDSLVCFLHSPSGPEQEMCDYAIQSSRVRLVDIGGLSSVPRRTLFPRRHTRLVQQHLNELDAMLLRGPSPLLPAIAHCLGEVPPILLVVGEYLPGIDELQQPRWRKEAIRLWAAWNSWQQSGIARRSLTFVNSHALYEKLKPSIPHLVETRTTTLYLDDFFEREDTCAGRPYHLLYTGRITRSKGLLQMIEALAVLTSCGEDLVLDLVGWEEKGEKIIQELEDLISARQLQERVVFHGYKAVGEELFVYYRQADIYVMPSLSLGEGFPRTLWEAMAHSLPIVATYVGSIPYILEGAAELVLPHDVDALVKAILKLLHEPEIRQRYIHAAVQRARENTLDQLSRSMVETIEEWITPSR